MLATAWRLIVKRILADWLILSAAMVTILLAITLLAAGPIYANGVGIAEARRTLEDAGVTRSNVEVSTRARSDAYQDIDAVTAELQPVLEPTGAMVVRPARRRWRFRAGCLSFRDPASRWPDRSAVLLGRAARRTGLGQVLRIGE